MDVEKAYRLALEKLNDYGLQNWDIMLDTAKSRFGCCYHRQRLITLSKVLIDLNTEADVLDTILHEIAHALVGVSHGHDRVWRQKAIDIGCNGKRCYGEHIIQPPTKYQAMCPSCNTVYHRNRRTPTGIIYFCPPCHRKSLPASLLFVSKELSSQYSIA